MACTISRACTWLLFWTFKAFLHPVSSSPFLFLPYNLVKEIRHRFSLHFTWGPEKLGYLLPSSHSRTRTGTGECDSPVKRAFPWCLAQWICVLVAPVVWALSKETVLGELRERGCLISSLVCPPHILLPLPSTAIFKSQTCEEEAHLLLN